MAVSYQTFVARFPEFEGANRRMVEIELANAANQVPSDVWGAQADDAIGLLAAHLVALRPAGEFARLKTKDGSLRTTYGDQYERMQRRIICGDRVI